MDGTRFDEMELFKSHTSARDPYLGGFPLAWPSLQTYRRETPEGLPRLTNSKLDDIDAKIGQVATAITNLEGEMVGLRFARSLIAGDKAENFSSASEKTSQEAAGNGMGNLGANAYIMQAIDESPSGLGYSEVVVNASAKAGKTLNPKTVSSALDVLKKKKQLMNVNGKYTRYATHLAHPHRILA